LMLELKRTSVLVIGSGISGLFTALKIAELGQSVLLLTKTSLHENNSRYAQGGIAAVIPGNMDDSIELHVKDTLVAGAGLCDPEAVKSILSEGFPAVEDLLRYGVPFDLTPNHDLAVTQEAAHSTRRIIHAGGDATGYSVEMTLIEKVKSHAHIEVMEYCQVIELLAAGEKAYGCRAVNYKTQTQCLILAEHTVLATGGVGQIYKYTTNPSIATGDGIALAHQVGATVRDMEFVQFHPTAFYDKGTVHFLISEALRGEGGILTNSEGVAFAKQYHPDGELSPRDILTRAIFSELSKTQSPCVYLDISHLAQDHIENRFPTILANCQTFGVDIRTSPIPVTPAAHYMMGGVAVDLKGKSSLNRLYVVGEAAHTGLHGANRLASNSLLECVVLARRVAETIGEIGFQDPSTEITLPEPLDLSEHVVQFDRHCPELNALQSSLRELMWRKVGIVRQAQALDEVLVELDTLENTVLQHHWHQILPQGLETWSQIRVARMITQAAIQRKDSLGAHFRLNEESQEAQPMATVSR
jgi:L-aspartate oxidase